MVDPSKVFRGRSVELMTERLALEIVQGRLPHLIKDCDINPKDLVCENDREAARRALEYVAKVADQLLAESFDAHQRETRRREQEAHDFYKNRLRLYETRLAAVGDLLATKRKTVAAEDVKAALNLTLE